MHILEDPSCLSARAQDFLRRTGRRERPVRFELPIEMWQVHDRAGRLVPAPMELIIRCEGFEQRFGGLRYQVRHSWVVGGERGETAYGWEYDHLGLHTRAWQDPRQEGWYFEWIGQRVSKPCRDLIHSDGSVGTDVDGNSPYLPLAPSILHLIESHALTDTVVTWRPWPVGDFAGAAASELLTGLVEVPEASWESSRWRLSDTVAVLDRDGWDRENPRRRTRIWSREEAGHREVQAALDNLQHVHDQGAAVTAGGVAS
ncbi:hypothetical protein [Streptomyces ipomoeae]|uniref:hypothetical protein n=1 Tax=Streptomyces ipomoeae TaxID=103232 RepID=UPI001146F18D|nr:hypothetical protein [Streptomyces ipomoeae]MDX2938633.1 hypothetical protein [Streptomyces ipomoeae]TQE18449.1 hypothetical protein SipoB123_34655 [Streptomyces ipomoeae]